MYLMLATCCNPELMKYLYCMYCIESFSGLDGYRYFLDWVDERVSWTLQFRVFQWNGSHGCFKACLVFSVLMSIFINANQRVVKL